MSASGTASAHTTRLAPERLTWSAAVVVGASVLHWPHLPMWVVLLLLGCVGWGLGAAWRGWPLPSRWTRIGAALLAFFAVLSQFRTLNGLEAGSALLVVMVALKFVETRTQRDQLVLMIIGYFLMFASLLYERGLLSMAYLLAFVWVTTVGLLQLGRRGPLLPSRPTARLAGRMLLQALPIMLVLFLLFPRLPGPLWGMPASTGATLSGLSDSMSPGDITELGLSEEVVFRVHFSDRAPEPDQLYWRGPVLYVFDGRAWSRPRGTGPAPSDAIEYRGEPVEYRVQLEPQGRSWAFALDMPRRWQAERDLRMSSDYQLRVFSFAPLRSRLEYSVSSHLDYRAYEPLSPVTIERYLRVPQDTSPRTRALVDGWRAESGDPRRLVARALTHFRGNDFYYTLAPRALGNNPVDEFLFETREGFCEHYASAFTVMMRLAGVPARVVTGYQGGERNPLGEYYIVRQSDAHAWSEVWLEDEGWVRVDPTAAVSPDRIALGSARAALGEDGGAGMSLTRQWTRNAVLAWDAVNAYWTRWVMGYGPELQRTLLEAWGLGRVRLQELTLLAVAATGLCLAALAALPAWRRRRGARRDDAARRFAGFCQRLRSARVPPPGPGEGPAAFALRAKARLPHCAAEIDAIVSAYLAARYEPDPAGEALHRLQRLVGAFRPRAGTG